MKKLLTLVCTFCLLFVLTVSASAADHTVSGAWVFNDTISANVDLDIETEFVSNGNTYKGLGLNATGTNYSTRGILRYHTDGPWSVNYIKAYSNGAWQNDAYKTVIFKNPVVFSESEYNWLTANASQPTCDGSTCPATDWNYDNVCDDCGMTFSVLRSYSWPALPSVDGAYQNYFIYQSDGKYTLYIISSDTSYTVDAEASGGYLTFGTSEVSSSYKYTYDGGTDWYRESSRNDVYYNNKVNAGSTSVELLVSTFNWYDEDGGLFFPKPLPLHLAIGEMTAVEMGEVLPEAVGTMKILAVCGVGCLALLAVLKLFGKRLLIFRN